MKKELKRKQYGTQQVAGKNQKLKDKKAKKKTKGAVVPSAEPPQNVWLAAHTIATHNAVAAESEVRVEARGEEMLVGSEARIAALLESKS